MNLDFVLLIGSGMVVVGLISWGLAAFSNNLKGKTEIKRAKKMLEGKINNSLKLDGEKITITKFKWKNKEGVEQELEIKPIKENTTEGKKGFLGLFKTQKSTISTED